MEQKFIPVAAPVLNGNEKKYVDDCLDSTWISSSGKYISLLEKSFAKFCEVEHAFAVNNGTAALHLALLALGIGPGDEVIVPTFTYVASANCVTYVGAKPVFVDCDLNTWNMDPTRIAAAITPRTKAIIAVHIYGLPADMPAIMEIAAQHHLAVVEDASEAHGAKINGRMVGTWGHISTFSFFGNKIITTGEGGMVVTDQSELAMKVSQLKGQGVDPGRRYWFPVIGYNYRMTNIEAAIGLAQLENIGWHLAQHKRIADLYHSLLHGTPGITFQAEPVGYESSHWMASILIDPSLADRDWVMAELLQSGIETRPFFYPMHRLPIYENGCAGQEFPSADLVGSRGINLPSSAALTDDEIRYVCDQLQTILAASDSVRLSRKADTGL